MAFRRELREEREKTKIRKKCNFGRFRMIRLIYTKNNNKKTDWRESLR